MTAGAPTKYREEYVDLGYKFSLLGATDEQLARNFEVDVSTVSNWKNEHPEFLEALKKGKEQADATVAKSLYHRATGYEHPEVDVKMFNGEIILTELVKHYPPDTGAAIFWLKNRQKDAWRDKVESEQTIVADVTSNGETLSDRSVLDDIMQTLKDKTAEQAN